LQKVSCQVGKNVEIPLNLQLMRLLIGEPVWAVLNQPQEGHPTRQEYVKNVMGNTGFALAARWICHHHEHTTIYWTHVHHSVIIWLEPKPCLMYYHESRNCMMNYFVRVKDTKWHLWKCTLP
jgi:1,2-dihydroxy-3-keto-5-methylthiopentene dioxygenase